MLSPPEHVSHCLTDDDDIVESVMIHPSEYLFWTLGRRDWTIRYLVVMTHQHLAWREISVFESPRVMLQSYLGSAPRSFSAIAWSNVRCVEARICKFGLSKTMRFHLKGTSEAEQVVEFDDVHLSAWCRACRKLGLGVRDGGDGIPIWKQILQNNGWTICFCLCLVLMPVSFVAASLLDPENALRDWMVCVLLLGILYMMTTLFALTGQSRSTDDESKKIVKPCTLRK